MGVAASRHSAVVLWTRQRAERRHGQLQDVAVARMVRAVRDRSCVGGEQVHLHEVHRAAGSAGGGILVCGVSG